MLAGPVRCRRPREVPMREKERRQGIRQANVPWKKWGLSNEWGCAKPCIKGKSGSSMVRMLGGILISLALMAMLSTATAQAATRNFQVRCYVNHQIIGTLTIYDVSMAANACNKTFNICEGNCTGCFIDVNFREVCIDSLGQAYYD
jgi:hypothetical protein